MQMFDTVSDIPVAGFADEKLAGVRDAFEENLRSGADLGASVAITLEGETVVDLWGGWADEARTRPWQKDTIVNVYSTTKTMAALTALLLADRGLLDFDAPVARYWPEFAANGKERVKVSHFMSHSAGLAGWQEKITTADLYDWEKATSLLAAQAPWWEPGTASGYHALTQGYLIGEVVRRITGRSLGTVFREEIAEPLDADFHIGHGPEHDHRISDLIPPPPGGDLADGDFEPSEMMTNFLTNPGLDPLDTRTRAWRAAEIPAAGGHGNGRSIAEIHTLLANGGVAKGKRLLSEAGARKALEPLISGEDLLMGMPVSYAHGFGIGSGLGGDLAEVKRPESIFWGGYGGSLALIDMRARTSFGYAMNRMGLSTVGDERTATLARAMWAGLEA
jgi:CubicO group peptidase (beta-lactamase class C family)